MQEWQSLTQSPQGELAQILGLTVSTATGSAWQGPTAQELQDILQKTPNLQQLSLHECTNLTALPSCITSLQCLTVLRVRCPRLAALPWDMSALKLTQLELVYCVGLEELPQHFPGTLQTLDLTGCSKLTALPSAVGDLPDLRKLDLSGCRALVDVPGSLAECRELQKVTFDLNPELEQAVGRQLLQACSSAEKKELPAQLRKLGAALSGHKTVLKLSSDQLRMTESLERLSWLAVLLATATYVGFLQPPFGTTVSVEQSTVINKSMPVENRAFFLLNAWSFLLSLSALVVIVLTSMPHIASSSVRREAGRFWLLLSAAWGLLYLAIATGAGAFMASAFAVYGQLDKTGLIFPVVVGVSHAAVLWPPVPRVALVVVVPRAGRGAS
jgi:hypothetical protein